MNVGLSDLVSARQALIDVGRSKSAALVKLHQRTANMQLYPPLRRWALAVQRKLAMADVPVFVSQGPRGKLAQDAALASGNSKARWPHSPHNWGMAVDFVHHRILYDGDADHYQVLSAMMLEIARAQNLPLVWGGNWKFYDPTHYEVADWGRIVEEQGLLPVP